jgi:hypothetical protein
MKPSKSWPALGLTLSLFGVAGCDLAALKRAFVLTAQDCPVAPIGVIAKAEKFEMPRGIEGAWLDAHYSTAGVGALTTTSVKVTKSAFAREEEGKVFYVGIGWEVKNTDIEPAGFGWQNKFLMDKAGHIYSPSDGKGTGLLQPGFESKAGPFSLYRIPSSVDLVGLSWGLKDESRPALHYVVAINPASFATFASACRKEGFYYGGATKNGKWTEVEPHNCFQEAVTGSSAKDDGELAH